MTRLPVQADAASHDSLQRVVDSVFAQPAYRWVERPNPFAFLQRWWDAIVQWLQGLEANQPMLYWVLFWALVALLAAIVVHALFVMSRTLRSAHAPGDTAPAPLARIRGAAWYRGEARRLAATGHFPEAMQADFLGLVLELDQRNLLRFHPSKTPNEYTYEVRLTEASRESFRRLVRTLYGYAFARQPCGPAEFEQWHGQARAEQYASAV